MWNNSVSWSSCRWNLMIQELLNFLPSLSWWECRTHFLSQNHKYWENIKAHHILCQMYLTAVFKWQTGILLFFQEKVRDNTHATAVHTQQLYSLDYPSKSLVLNKDLKLCTTDFNSRYVHLSTGSGENLPFLSKEHLWLRCIIKEDKGSTWFNQEV